MAKAPTNTREAADPKNTVQDRVATDAAPVTELAEVNGDTSNKTLEQMAGVAKEPYRPDQKEPSQASDQQKDALESLKQARDDGKPKTAKQVAKEEAEDAGTFSQGPGGMVA